MKRHVVQVASKAEIRREEQSDKTESCRENLWNEMRVERAIQTEIDVQKKRIQRSGQARLVNVSDINRCITTT